MGHHSLDKLDKKILQMVSEDARIPFLEVARECNVSGAAIHQRIQKLINLGVIKGSQFNIDPEKIGYETCAYIGINLKDPSNFRKITEEVECHYTTGEFDIFIKMYAFNNKHLMNIIHERLHPLGLASTHSMISYHSEINRQLPKESIQIPSTKRTTEEE